jgi:hypothetical protein
MTDKHNAFENEDKAWRDAYLAMATRVRSTTAVESEANMAAATCAAFADATMHLLAEREAARAKERSARYEADVARVTAQRYYRVDATPPIREVREVVGSRVYFTSGTFADLCDVIGDEGFEPCDANGQPLDVHRPAPAFDPEVERAQRAVPAPPGKVWTRNERGMVVLGVKEPTEADYRDASPAEWLRLRQEDARLEGSCPDVTAEQRDINIGRQMAFREVRQHVDEWLAAAAFTARERCAAAVGEFADRCGRGRHPITVEEAVTAIRKSGTTNSAPAPASTYDAKREADMAAALADLRDTVAKRIEDAMKEHETDEALRALVEELKS